MVALEQNYRSTKTILDVANAVIVNNVARVPKDLWTDIGEGEPVCRYRAEDERDEALWVASEIARLHRDEGLHYGDVAVFYRTNAQSRVLEEDLVRAGIPYKVVGGTRFYDRREVRDVLAYLKVLLNPADEVSCRRIVNVPKRGVGDASVDRIANLGSDTRPFVRRRAVATRSRRALGEGRQGRKGACSAARRDESPGRRRPVARIARRSGPSADGLCRRPARRAHRRVGRKTREPDRAADGRFRVRQPRHLPRVGGARL